MTVTKGTLRLGEVGPEIEGPPGSVLTFGPDGRTLSGQGAGSTSATLAAAENVSVPNGAPVDVIEFAEVPANAGGLMQITLHGVAGPVPGGTSVIEVVLVDAGGVKAFFDRAPVADALGADNAPLFAGDNGDAFTLSGGLISFVELVAPVHVRVTLTGTQDCTFDRAVAAFFPF